MEAFATVNDLESRWRVMDSAMRARAEVLLLDAAACIVLEMGPRFKVDPSDEVQAANLVRISCDMVLRVLDYENAEHAWGGDAVTVAHKGMYLPKKEKSALRSVGARIGSLSPMGC